MNPPVSRNPPQLQPIHPNRQAEQTVYEHEGDEIASVIRGAVTPEDVAEMIFKRRLSGIPWDLVTASFSEAELLAYDPIKQALTCYRPTPPPVAKTDFQLVFTRGCK